MERSVKDINALTRTYDLLLWIIPVIEKFPKSQRFLLGDRIESMLLDVMEHIIQAVYTKNKIVLLRDANLKLEKLRYLIRLVKDLKYLSIKRYEFAAKSINEIGTELGGWIKYTQSHR
jgi:four helix bundle protein